MQQPPREGKTARMALVRRAIRITRATTRFAILRVAHGGRPSFVGRAPVIDARGQLIIGQHLMIRCLPRMRSYLGVEPGGRLELGDRVFVNEGVHICAERDICIGDDVMIGPWVVIYDTDFHEVAPDESVRVEPVRIGNNVWIGHSAILLPGVTIGDHAVIAAGAVVTRPVAPRTVVGGNPARVLRTFDCPDTFVRH